MTDDNLPPPDGFLDQSLGGFPAYTVTQVEEIRRAAILAERERCAKVCDDVATHGRYQMEIDQINTAFWNGYAAGADQCATDILESNQ